ncbi:diguanylate cyclase domain-containing protein [Nocardia tengchongensis]|uniref:diguanylate cyclase domain-containing protein n=1 Tax=Nocardia tengchongensis TaxID=2055889 RepID=UPI00365D9076
MLDGLPLPSCPFLWDSGRGSPIGGDILATINAEWIESLSHCALPQIESVRLVEAVHAAVGQLTAALAGEYPDLEAVRQVAAGLVDVGATDPVVVARSVPVLCDLAERAGHGRVDRVAAIVGAFGEGFARAAVDVTETRFEGMEAAYRNTPVAIVIGSAGGLIYEVNPTFERLMGVRAEDWCGRPGHPLLPPDQRERALRQLGSGERFTSQGPLPQADGTEVWMAWTGLPATSKSGRHYMLGFGQDITEQRKATEALKWQALHDPLTLLANRRHLLEHLARTAASAGPTDEVGVCALDLDAFKPVNDLHGHLVGDQLLVEVAHRMQAAVGADCFLARVGGDEFVVVMVPPTDRDGICAILSGLQAALREPFHIGGHVLNVTVSVGAVLGPVAGRDLSQVLDAADQVLYEAKTQGADRLVLRRLTTGGDLESGPQLR